MEPWEFGRLAKVTSAYDEARARGEKHSVAVREAVGFLRRYSPTIPISESVVKRILSTFRPKGSGTILRFERSLLSKDEMQRYRWVREQIAALQDKQGLTLPPLPAYDETRRREKFTIRYSERPDYPRHNRKNPKE
jgi:hypothetical protein